MFRLYSKGCEYAVRALAQLAPAQGGRFQAKTICEKADIPESFTRKVFQALVQTNFFDAVRGPGGGYALTKHPSEISLLEIIHAVDGIDTFSGCIMGLDECDSTKPCPLHTVWADAKSDLLAQLGSKTLQDLLDTMERRKSEGHSDEADVINLVMASPE